MKSNLPSINILANPPKYSKLTHFKDVFKTLPDSTSDNLLIPIDSNHSLDLSKAPHILIAGQTGSGKSCFINSLICSLILQKTPEELELILIDPKVVELTPYGDIPHLKFEVATDLGSAKELLKWTCEEMERRFQILSKERVRNISGYNLKSETKMSKIVVIIDEFGDLMYMAKKEIEGFIIRLAQKSRAVGIHLILATQRPSREVVTGILKANVPVRICFKVASQIDSRIVLDAMGGETLKGNGEMLLKGSSEIDQNTKFQGCFLSDEEIEIIIGSFV